MLVIEDNSVYEIDEECIRKRKVPKECNVYEKILKERKREVEDRKNEKGVVKNSKKKYFY